MEQFAESVNWTSFQSFLHLCLSYVLTACPPGTFKSTQGPGLCLQCPPNSRSTSEAATICVCRNGYYRGDADQPDEPCTSEFIRHGMAWHSHKHCHTLALYLLALLIGVFMYALSGHHAHKPLDFVSLTLCVSLLLSNQHLYRHLN